MAVRRLMALQKELKLADDVETDLNSRPGSVCSTREPSPSASLSTSLSSTSSRKLNLRRPSSACSTQEPSPSASLNASFSSTSSRRPSSVSSCGSRLEFISSPRRPSACNRFGGASVCSSELSLHSPSRKPQRAQNASASRTRRGNSSTKASRKHSQSSTEFAQTQALKALLESKQMDGASSVSDVLRSVLGGCLLAPSGWRLLPDELIAGLLPQQEKCDVEVVEHAQADLEITVALVLRVLRQASELLGSSFSDVAGQVLWRNRRASVLQNPLHKAVVEDLSWAFSSSSSARDVIEVSDFGEDIQNYFSSLTSGRQDRMFHQQWQQVVAVLTKNPVLKSRVKASEVEHIFFAAERKNTQNAGGIRYKVFKRLLIQLAESTHVHPWMVILALGAHWRQQSICRPSTA